MAIILVLFLVRVIINLSSFTLINNYAGSVSFNKLTVIPGAVVGLKPRLDGLGYRLEASIPLALFPEITKSQVIHYYE